MAAVTAKESWGSEAALWAACATPCCEHSRRARDGLVGARPCAVQGLGGVVSARRSCGRRCLPGGMAAQSHPDRVGAHCSCRHRGGAGAWARGACHAGARGSSIRNGSGGNRCDATRPGERATGLRLMGAGGRRLDALLHGADRWRQGRRRRSRAAGVPGRLPAMGEVPRWPGRGAAPQLVAHRVPTEVDRRHPAGDSREPAAARRGSALHPGQRRPGSRGHCPGGPGPLLAGDP